MLAAPLALVLAATLTTAAQATYPGAVGDIAFSATADGNDDIYAANPDGSNVRRLTTDAAFDACPAYDADGERIAWCRGELVASGIGSIEIWTMNADGTDQEPLTDLGGFATFPDFSPNGHKVAFTTRESPAHDFDIWTIRDNGRHPRNLTDSPDADEVYPAWSPDGRWIAFIRTEVGAPTGQLWIMDRQGRRQRQITFDEPLKQQLPDWHPDGKVIAYEAGRDLWLIHPDGSRQRNITNTPGVAEYGPAWSPDGERIAFLEFDERLVHTMRADGTDVRLLTSEPGLHRVPAWQPRPDHKHHHR
jgi:TolB protein